MATNRLDKIVDAELKARLTEANQQLRTGRATEAVHTLADTFLWMLRARPEMLDATVPLYDAASEAGLGDLDAAALCRYLEELGGLER